MKMGQPIFRSVEIFCPCGGFVPSPHGSTLWDHEDFLKTTKGKCDSCSEIVKVPASTVKRISP